MAPESAYLAPGDPEIPRVNACGRRVPWGGVCSEVGPFLSGHTSGELAFVVYARAGANKAVKGQLGAK